MITRLLRSQSNVGVRYALMGTLMMSLLIVGFIIGNALNTIVQLQSNSTSNTDTRTTGGLTAGARVNPPHLLQDFTLTSQTGEPISLGDLRGRAAVLFFGYTHCPEECPTTMANFKRVKQMLGDQADQAAFVFISVDGTRDTPAQLTSFLDQFDPEFIGMTGSEDTLRRIGGEYGLVFSQEGITAPAASDDEADGADTALDPQNYFVQHTSPAFLVDRDGYLRTVFFYGTQPEAIADGIREVLK